MAPVPSTSSVTVDRRLLRLAVQLGRRASSHASDLLECGEERVVLGGRADRHPETCSTRGQREKSRTSTPRSSSRSQSSCASPSTRNEQEVRARRIPRAARGIRAAPRTAGRAPRRACATRVSISARNSSATSPASCVGTESAYGSATFSSSSTTHAGPDREPEPDRGERPHLRVRAHDDERARLVDELDRAPRRELAVGLVDDEQGTVVARERRQAFDLPRGRRRCRSGCSGCTRTRSLGALDASSSSAAVDVDREVGGPLPRDDLGARDAGDVRVQRVRRLEHRRAPARPAVGEQQRLQHLVGAVRAEHALGRLAEERAEAGPQRVAARSG